MGLPVVVRRYANDRDFSADASIAAGSGYRVVSVSREARPSGAGMIWFLVAVAIGLAGFAYPLLWIAALLFGLLAATGRRHDLIVTYQQAGLAPTW